jgi:AcrR family transcriptional regulator
VTTSSGKRSVMIDDAATSHRPGPGARKALATRAALVDLAADLFAEQGYLQSSIRDVARRGSVTTWAIYGHFRIKADLLVEAINTRTAVELEAQSIGLSKEPDHIEILTRQAKAFPKRRALRALIVQGAAAAHTDPETRDKLRTEQLSHIDAWINGYERDRERLGIDPSVDLQAAVIFSWAVELGLGVLESVGIEPGSRKGWADMFNRFGRSLQLPPDDQPRTPPRRQARKRE